MKRIIALLAILVTLGLAGCSNQLNDVEGIGQAKPDYILTYLNVQDFPNVTMLCIRGAGFATITRDYGSLTPVPAWNAFCLTKERV
jgi:outer membrane lipoprotein SlyB